MKLTILYMTRIGTQHSISMSTGKYSCQEQLTLTVKNLHYLICDTNKTKSAKNRRYLIHINNFLLTIFYCVF